MYGIPEGTWIKGMAEARRQPGGVVIAREQVAVGNEVSGVGRMQHKASTSECVLWWKGLIREWDMIQDETPPHDQIPSRQCRTQETASHTGDSVACTIQHCMRETASRARDSVV